MTKYGKNKGINIISIIIAIMLIFLVLSSAVSLLDGVDETGRIVLSPTYKVGGLVDYGKFKETDKSIYTEEMFKCKGLQVNYKFESNVKYVIYFYDKDGLFLKKTEELEQSYKNELDEIIVFARIVIIPLWSDTTPESEKKIAWYSVRKYASALQIKVFENQDETIEERISPNNSIFC